MAIIAGPTITRSPCFEPACHDHFCQSLRNTDLCRPSLAAIGKNIQARSANAIVKIPDDAAA